MSSDLLALMGMLTVALTDMAIYGISERVIAMAQLPKSVIERGTTWIYAGNPERKAMLQQLLEYTKAASLSEAIFIAVAEYLKQIKRSGKAPRRTFSSLEGLWKGKADFSLEEIEAAELKTETLP